MSSELKALKGGNLLDGTGKPPIENAAIIFGDSRIKAVGRADEVSIPTDAEVIDCSGKTIMPGLIDCHCHLANIRNPKPDWLEARLKTSYPLMSMYAVCNARRLLESGFTTVRDPGGGICSDSTNSVGRALRDAINWRIVPGPRLVIGGWVVRTNDEPDWATMLPTTIARGTESLNIPHFTPVNGVVEARKCIREMVRAGVDLVKIEAHTSAPFEELKAAGEEAHLWNKQFSVHALTADECKKAIEAGADTIEHALILDDDVIKLMVDKGIFMVPTMTVVSERSQEQYVEIGFNGEWIKLLQWAEKEYNKSFPKAYKAGVKIALGTDTSRNFLHGENALELELMVHRGMSPMEAIVASTKTASEIIDQAVPGFGVGTLEEDKLADVLVVDGDPLRDIKILQDKNKILLVIKGGDIEVDRRQ